MGYPKRNTLGRCDCRPKEFKTNNFPPPNFLCSSLCLYHIFCMEELNNKKSLGDRIKNLRLSFQKPYYFFSMMENGNRMLVFESEEGKELTFREKNIIGCVAKAEDYLEVMQIRSGKEANLKKQQEKEQKDESVTPPPAQTTPPTNPSAPQTPTTPPSTEDDTVEVETSIITGDGKKHKGF